MTKEYGKRKSSRWQVSEKKKSIFAKNRSKTFASLKDLPEPDENNFMVEQDVKVFFGEHCITYHFDSKRRDLGAQVEEVAMQFHLKEDRDAYWLLETDQQRYLKQLDLNRNLSSEGKIELVDVRIHAEKFLDELQECVSDWADGVVKAKSDLKKKAYHLTSFLQVDYFAEEFIALSGIAVLVDVITRTSGQRNIQGYAWTALASLLVYYNALEWIKESPGLIDWLFSYVGSNNIQVVKQSLLLLTVLCDFTDDGFEFVSKSAHNAALECNITPYSDVVNCLRAGDLDIVVNALQFINVLLQQSDEEVDRPQLCYLLQEGGIFPALLELRKMQNIDLTELMLEFSNLVVDSTSDLQFDNWALKARILELRRDLVEKEASLAEKEAETNHIDTLKEELHRYKNAVRDCYNNYPDFFINQNCPFEVLEVTHSYRQELTMKETDEIFRMSQRITELEAAVSGNSNVNHGGAILPDTSKFEPSKYLKMLEIGTPHDDVRNRVIKDGFDSTLFDVIIATIEKQQPATTPPQSTQETHAHTPSAPKGFDVSKYKKMKKMGVPEPSIRNKIKQDGFDPALYDSHVAVDAAASSPAVASSPSLPEPPKGFDVSKYKKMHKMRVPEQSIRNKIKQDGFDTELYDVYVSETKAPIPVAAVTAPSKPQPPKGFDVSKYKKMVKMGVPEAGIRNKIKADGFDGSFYEFYVTETKSPEPAPGASTAPVPPKGFDVSKYKKMIKMGVPEPAIRNKIKADGFDKSCYDIYVTGTQAPKATPSLPPPPKGFDVSKYKKMMKMRVPEASIRNKIRADGFDADLFDKYISGKTASTPLVTKKVVKKKPTGPIPTKPAIQPLKKMKNLHWSRMILDPKDKTDNIWSKMKSSLKVNEKQLVSLFGRDVKAVSNKIVKKSSNRNKKKQVLDAKRFQNLSILMSSLPPISSIRNHILGMDDAISCSQVEQLLAKGPTPDDMNLLAGEDPKALAAPERLLLILNDIPHFSTRLRCWKYIMDFDAEFQSCEKFLRNYQIASAKLLKSNTIKHVFSLILQIGNYLNGGTRKGQADGFSLDTLKKLSGVRTKDRRTLLAYVAQLCKDKIPDSKNLKAELRPLEEAAKTISLIELKNKIQKLKNQFKKNKENAKNVEKADQNDIFASKSRTFFNKRTGAVAKLGNSLDLCTKTLNQVIRYFTLKKPDLSATNEFFGEFWTFIVRLDACMPKDPLVTKRSARKHKIGAKITSAGRGKDAMKNLIDAVKMKQNEKGLGLKKRKSQQPKRQKKTFKVVSPRGGDTHIGISGTRISRSSCDRG